MTAPPEDVAAALTDGIGLLARRLRQVRPTGDLSHPESIAISSLERHGPSTSAELARHENVRAQSMHATLAGLAHRGLVERTTDPTDRRRVVVSLTPEGRAAAQAKRDARSSRLISLLTEEFSAAEREVLLAAAPLLARLGRTV